MVGLGILGILGAFEGAARTAEGDGFLLPGPDEADLKVLLRSPEERNAHGFRDRDRELARHEGLGRVVVLGDSVTFGQGVARDQAFPAIADALLPDVEVLNLGETGFDLQQITGMARHRVPAWQPDRVVYAFHTNDRVETRVVRVGKRGRPLHVGTELSAAWTRLRDRSALVRLYLGSRALRDLAAAGVPGEAEQAAFLETWAPRLVEEVGAARLLVFTVPHHRLAAEDCAAWSGDPASCAADRAALDQAMAVFGGLGVAVVPGLPALRRVGVDALVLPSDAHHPSPAGHRALGQALAAALSPPPAPAD